ncbi:NUDIX domain-containing protein [Natrarchaeobius oligotrophus]|uniref:NUDIX domain-containing protein n=1 Tax=Natrarchaeobius oligotrophus TaxID=3455743 RepID=UPI0014054FCD|nr:NUDIX domain-containing protein [Natrarchaeobius chitinivorans]
MYLFRETDGTWEIALLEHKKLGKWMVPGGHVEPNENPCEAAVREVREELDLKLRFLSSNHAHFSADLGDARETITPELIVEEFIRDDYEDGDHIHVDCLYLARVRSGELDVNEREAATADWVTQESLPREEMFESTERLADHFFSVMRTGDYRSIGSNLTKYDFDLHRVST